MVLKPLAKPGALPWLVLSLVVLVLDQWTKWLVLEALQPYQTIEAIGGFLNWTLAFNTGAAFSFLANAGGWQRWLLSALAAIIALVLAVWLARTPRSDWRTALPLSLIIGGALGNLLDRVRLGHVVDFVDVYFGDWHYPAFNLADSAVCVGAVLLILFGFFTPTGRSVR